MSLLKIGKDKIESLIEEFLEIRIRTYEYYNYFIVDEYILVIKVFDKNDRLLFTVKTALYGSKLQIVEVS